jgi:hypothetical protein
MAVATTDITSIKRSLPKEHITTEFLRESQHITTLLQKRIG